MTLAADMVTDLAVFFDTDEFAVSCTFTHGGTSATIKGIFQEAGESALGYENTAPSLLCKASDVTTAARKDTFVIGGVTRYMIGKNQPTIGGFRNPNADASADGLLAEILLSEVSP